jgi:hypothetical protein
MINTCNLYKSQYKKAKETLDLLTLQRAEIDFKLLSNPISAILHKELRDKILDIKITSNELEQAESDIKDCESRHNIASI